jgi:V/A-type H+-transporting ATPase subunit I
MVIREPLANFIRRKKPLYHETVSAYYIESGFELLETFLGMLSNSISFIRVGAFALNHVGLFMAFHTIAKLLDSAMGEVSMFIIGNLIVIALEGLIVLIQGLRLVYYEMFSKYYTGDGLEFVPVSIENVGGKK